MSMEDMDFTFVENLAQYQTMPKGGILSQTIYEDDQLRVVLFSFDTDEELTEHTSADAAMLYVVSGEATLTLGDKTMEAHPGAWAQMPARLPHAIYAETPLVLLLIMSKTPRGSR